jgi:hypothetical protein
MFALHDKVNAKLDGQRLKNVEPVTVPTETHRSRQITFDCLAKRFVVRPVAFCTDDVWEVLELFAVNFPTPEAKEYDVKLNGYSTFLQLLPDILDIAGAESTLTATLRAGLHMLPRVLAGGGELLLYWVLAMKSALHNVTINVNDEIAALNVAKAHKCKHGSCV